MSDPIGALSNILKGKKTANTAANSDFASPSYTLPNGGGSYGVGGLNQPLVQMPSVPTPQFTPQTAAEAPMGPFMNTPSAQPVTPTPPTKGINPNPSNGGSDLPQHSIDVNSKIIRDIANSQASGVPLGSYGMEGGYQGDMPTSEALRIEMLKDRAQGTGLYSVPKGQYASYDQIMGVRAMADKHYTDMINSSSEAEKNSAAAAKTKAENNPEVTDYSSDPWMQGLVVNGLVQGGTVAERKAHEAMLAKLPAEQKQQLIKSSLYNSLSPTERSTFDRGDNLGAGVKQILSDIPEDFTTNPYKYAAQKYSVYLGGKQDPKYLNFKSMVGNLSAPIINEIYGAAVTGSELARAQNFIPDLATDSTEMAMTKLKHLAGFYEYANAKKLARKAGVPMTETMDDFISKYDPSVNKSSSKGSVSWDNILD